jgi:hypothetical protein
MSPMLQIFLEAAGAAERPDRRTASRRARTCERSTDGRANPCVGAAELSPQLPLPAGAATAAKQDALIGYVDGIEGLLAGNLSVVGNFYPATQPVSGNVGIIGTVPVSGTFWQATQPISGAVSITGSVAVTGTFWQATQPVSLAALPALVAGAAVIGKVGMDLTTPGTTNGVSLSHVGATAVAANAGMPTPEQRVAVATDQAILPVRQAPRPPRRCSVSVRLRRRISNTVKATAGSIYGHRDLEQRRGGGVREAVQQGVNPTLASDVPILVIPVPAASSVSPNLGASARGSRRASLSLSPTSSPTRCDGGCGQSSQGYALNYV